MYFNYFFSRVDLASKTAEIEGIVSESDIKAAIKEAGYEVVKEDSV